MKKLLAALLALLCLPVMTALGDTQGDFTYALTPEGAVVTMYYVEVLICQNSLTSAK